MAVIYRRRWYNQEEPGLKTVVRIPSLTFFFSFIKANKLRRLLYDEYLDESHKQEQGKFKDETLPSWLKNLNRYIYDHSQTEESSGNNKNCDRLKTPPFFELPFRLLLIGYIP